MPITNTIDILLKATTEKYAVGAFNCTSLVQMKAVLKTAAKLKSPVILQTSVTPAEYIGPEVIGSLFKTMAASLPIPTALHLDHCTDVEFCKACADAGYTGIMIDASKHPLSENIRQTRIVTAYCHERNGISVEGELGTVAGVEDQIKVSENEAALCDPEDAVRFVRETGVDIFAPAIGTAHGVYKTENPKIDLDRLERIGNLLNGNGSEVPLVVHGGTGLKSGVVKNLVSLGGSKFNVSTDLKHTLVDATYGYLANHRDEYNPGKIDTVVEAATCERISYWIDLLGSAGKA